MSKSTFLLAALAALPLPSSVGALADPAPAAPAAAPAVAAVPESPADRDFNALWAIFREKPPAANAAPEAALTWTADRSRRFADAAHAFAAAYPHDPRRWGGIIQSGYIRPFFIVGFKPEFSTHPGFNNVIEDAAKVAAFKAEQTQLCRSALAATDASPRQKLGAYGWLVTESFLRFNADPSAANRADYVTLVNEMIGRYPESAAMVARQYLGFLKASGTPAEQAAFTAKLADLKDPAIQRLLAESRGDYRRFAGVASLHFTAADGRPVDLASLRGKVVLVDFWATWCGPCKAEIPNVVANYKKYHDRGFEVVGVSLENSGVSDADSPETASAKLAAARTKMLQFTQSHEMPWAQYYDGKFWKNDLAKRFQVDSIPAMVLLDQTGKIVSIEARGPELERELKRLLAL